MNPIATTLAMFKGVRDGIALYVDGKTALPEAERSLKLLEVVNTLGTLQVAYMECAEENNALRAEADRLRSSLALAGNVRKSGDAYFLLQADGESDDEPLCLKCWELDSRLVHLTTSPGTSHERVCPKCRHMVDWRRIRFPERGTKHESR